MVDFLEYIKPTPPIAGIKTSRRSGRNILATKKKENEDKIVKSNRNGKTL